MAVELVDRPDAARPAARDAGVALPDSIALPDRAGPGSRLASLLRRLPIRRLDPAERERDRVRLLEDARALLERSRELVADGWVQDAFYVVQDRQGGLRPVSPLGLVLLSRTDVVGACLVGAVAHASSAVDRRDRRAPAAVAVDTLWDALGEQGGQQLPAHVDTGHPAARAARVRELARWNDEPQRTRDDVLELIDRAVSRTILGAVR